MDVKYGAARNRIKNLVGKIVLPKSKEQDVARKEFILNILLVSIIALILTGLAIHLVFWEVLHAINSQAYSNDTLPLSALFSILSFFVILLLLSRKGFYHISSYIFITLLLILAVFMNYRWGADVNAGLLLYVLIIIMSGILIDTNFSIVITIISSLAVFIFGYFQVNNLFAPNLYWRTITLSMTDIVMFIVIFLIIATISWLSNREIEKSLQRARKSERELKRERDMLEIKVEERTRQIKEMQAEKMEQLYHFAEFGRLSSGVFHDLINPLNAVILNMEKVKSQDDVNMISQTRTYLDSAVLATKKMEGMIIAIRKQISKQENNAPFFPDGEIREVIDILKHKAQKAEVEMAFYCSTDIETYGDALKFNQVALNLISNAIESYPAINEADAADSERKVIISLKMEDDDIVFIVRDNGAGISEENIDKIFTPFFTTKDADGMGIGLSTVKRIVEKDFGGTIHLESKLGVGSVFTIKFKTRSYENKQKEFFGEYKKGDFAS